MDKDQVNTSACCWRKACIRCSTRKERCDGELPCGRCRVAQADCAFEMAKRCRSSSTCSNRPSKHEELLRDSYQGPTSIPTAESQLERCGVKRQRQQASQLPSPSNRPTLSPSLAMGAVGHVENRHLLTFLDDLRFMCPLVDEPMLLEGLVNCMQGPIIPSVGGRMAGDAQARDLSQVQRTAATNAILWGAIGAGAYMQGLGGAPLGRYFTLARSYLETCYTHDSWRTVAALMLMASLAAMLEDQPTHAVYRQLGVDMCRRLGTIPKAVKQVLSYWDVYWRAHTKPMAPALDVDAVDNEGLVDATGSPGAAGTSPSGMAHGCPAPVFSVEQPPPARRDSPPPPPNMDTRHGSSVLHLCTEGMEKLRGDGYQSGSPQLNCNQTVVKMYKSLCTEQASMQAVLSTAGVGVASKNGPQLLLLTMLQGAQICMGETQRVLDTCLMITNCVIQSCGWVKHFPHRNHQNAAILRVYDQRSKYEELRRTVRSMKLAPAYQLPSFDDLTRDTFKCDHPTCQAYLEQIWQLQPPLPPKCSLPYLPLAVGMQQHAGSTNTTKPCTTVATYDGGASGLNDDSPLDIQSLEILVDHGLLP